MYINSNDNFGKKNDIFELKKIIVGTRFMTIKHNILFVSGAK